jgi:hypothetical protein
MWEVAAMSKRLRTIGLLFILIGIRSYDGLAQGTIGEAFATAGASVKPGSVPTLAAGFGGGWGERSMIHFSVGYSNLGDYALGIGRATSSGPISESRLWSLDPTFQFELIPRRRKAAVTPYVAAGAGFLFERFSAIPPACCLNPTSPRSDFDAHVFSPNLGGGIRVPLSARVGIRPEVKVWFTRENTGPSSIFVVKSDQFVTVTVSFYYRGGKSTQR